MPIIQMKKLMFKVIDFTSWWMSTNYWNPLLEIWFHQKQKQMWNSGKQVFLQYNKGFRKFCLSNIHMWVDLENWVFSLWKWIWWIISNKWFCSLELREKQFIFTGTQLNSLFFESFDLCMYFSIVISLWFLSCKSFSFQEN